MTDDSSVVYCRRMIDTSTIPAHGSDLRSIVATTRVAIDSRTAWDGWTSEEGLTAWWPVPACRIDLRVGGPFELLFDASAEPGQRGSEGCVFLGYVPGTMVSFTWNAPPHLPLRSANTWVVVTFTDTDDGATDVELTHTGFLVGPDWDDYMAYFESAWRSVLDLFSSQF